MFRRLRNFHKVVGLINALILMVIAVTGFLLATKNITTWIRPGEQRGTKVQSASEVISVAEVIDATLSAGKAELRTPDDIDRIDYRPGRNVFKVVSKEGNMEIQIDGASGKILQIAPRTDQWVEDIHDLSVFSEGARDYLLPVVAVCLFGLSASGVTMFFIPVFRRRKAQKQLAATQNRPQNPSI